MAPWFETRRCAALLSMRATVILRSRALARRLEGWPRALVAHPARLAVKNGEHLRMTAVLAGHDAGWSRDLGLLETSEDRSRRGVNP